MDSEQRLYVERADLVERGNRELILAAVLPEQFYSLPHEALRTRPEVALRRAVLDDALQCFTKQFRSNTRHDRRLAKEAEKWLFSDDDRWPFSFVNVCRALGLEPAYLRQGLRRWCQRPAAERLWKQRHVRVARARLRLAA
jgi:hypothetical protein